MRKILLVAALAIFATSCNKIKQLTQIEQDLPYTQQLDGSLFPDSSNIHTLPPGGVTITFPSVPVPTNSKQYLTQYNTSTDKINSVTLKSILLQMTAPAGKNLNFLHSVDVFIAGTSLPKIRVAYNDNIGKNSPTVSLNDTSADLKNYFLQDTIFVQFRATFDSIPPHGTQINTTTTFHLSANPLN
ncbi:MAG: hypothetical protein H0X33_10265 [Taibaiella sp.]|nr:hypothetical protein [Taibaiella sp.]